MKELWDGIQKYSEKQNHDRQIYELNARASQARDGRDSAMTYASNLKAIWMKIDYLWPTQSPQSVERQYSLKQHLFTFLMGLHLTYESLWIQVLQHEKAAELKEAIGIMRKEENRLKLVHRP